MVSIEQAAWPQIKTCLIVLLAGMALPLAFAPFNYYPLAVACLAIFFLCLNGVTAKQAAKLGYIFGLGFFGVGVSWIFVAIHVFGQASVLLAGLLTAAFVAFLALYLGLMAWLIKRYSHKRFTVSDYIFLLPVAWLGFEWFKSWFLTGFPWLELGVSQINGPLAGYVPIVGALGTSLLVAFTAGLVAAAWHFRRGSLLLIAILIWIAGPALSWKHWTQTKGEPLTVSLLQGNVPQDIKWDRDQVMKTLALYQTMTEDNWGSDIIVWPENAITAFYHQVEEFYLTPLAELAKENNTDILVGLPVLEQNGDKYYNSMLSLGSSQGFYHKRHLVPFGDYVPLEWLRGLIAFFDLPMSSFSSGADNQPLLEAKGHKIGISVCYEDTFSDEVLMTLPEANLLVNATNNAWYGDSFAPHQHLQISQSRALEMGRPVLRATTNGVSALIDHKGMLQATSKQFEQDVVTGQVQARQGSTPYVQWQRLPLLVLTLVMLMLWMYYRRNSPNEQMI